ADSGERYAAIKTVYARGSLRRTNSNRAAASRRKRGSLRRLHSTSNFSVPRFVRTIISASQPEHGEAPTFTVLTKDTSFNSASIRDNPLRSNASSFIDSLLFTIW